MVILHGQTHNNFDPKTL